jgi:predicted MFS family arabinose efflux permease
MSDQRIPGQASQEQQILTPEYSEWARGWKIIAVAFAAYVAGSTAMFFTFGLFLKSLSADFHWSRGAISGSLAVSSVTYAVASPLIGRLADRVGIKPVILTTTAVLALLFASQCLLTNHLWHFYALAGLMGMVTPGTSALTYAKVVSNWFDRRRGLALSVLACGTGVAGILAPPFAQHLIADFGWRIAYLLLGLTTLLIGFVPVALVLKDLPKTLTETASPSAALPATLAPRSKATFLSSSSFWILSAVSFVVGVTYVGVLSQLVPMLTDKGMSLASAAWAFSLLGGAVLVGHLLVGVGFDHFHGPKIAAIVLFLSGIGVAGIGMAKSRLLIVLCTMLLGAALGADIDLLPYLMSRSFSLRNFSELLGYSFAAGTIGSSLSSFLMGRVYDLYHSYTAMTNVIAAGLLLAALLVGFLPKTSHCQRESELQA